MFFTRLSLPFTMPIRCLISAGPTREYFDPVRFISNPSSGKMGYAIATAALAAGWETTLVSGPVALPAPAGAELVPVVTGEQMYTALAERFPSCDVLIMTAAVCDYRPKTSAPQKIKKHQLSMTVEMEPTRDILKTLAHQKQRQYVVGFAAETEHIEQHALEKLHAKNCDLIVANDVGGPTSAFESDHNRVILLGHNGTRTTLGPAPKAVIGEQLVAFLADCMALK